MDIALTPANVLPSDGSAGTLIGRAWVPGNPAGPSVVLVSGTELKDLSKSFATMSAVLAERDPTAAVQAAAAKAPSLGSLDAVLANTPTGKRDPQTPYLLAPTDLQAIKACGVTFAASMLERVIEERAKGDPTAAEGIRQVIAKEIGGDLRRIKPGSAEADTLKQALIDRGMWSQYLEVGIGP
jgi:fumarylacetoacetate (FAA) hydrolase family protein